MVAYFFWATLYVCVFSWLGLLSCTELYNFCAVLYRSSALRWVGHLVSHSLTHSLTQC